jgi:hypothetical protein
MIIIDYENINGGIVLSRPLTEEEKLKVTSIVYNGTKAIFYEKDEPTIDLDLFNVRNVEAWKIRGVLKVKGLFSSVELALNSLQEPNKTLALEAWEYSPTINMYSPIVKVIQDASNLTWEEVVTIFNEAEMIVI